jgi:hypothetical protein
LSTYKGPGSSHVTLPGPPYTLLGTATLRETIRLFSLNFSRPLLLCTRGVVTSIYNRLEGALLRRALEQEDGEEHERGFTDAER